MPEFDYTARTSEGRSRHGLLLAQDVEDLKEKLRLEGLTLTRSSVGRAKSVVSFLDRFSSVSTVQKMFFTQYLEVMIRAGFSLSRALETLAEQASNKYFRKVITDVRLDVEEGMAFAKSLAKHPKIFSEMYVNMIAAGEASGKLDDVLNRLSLKMRKDHALLAKLKGAMTYPIIIVIALVGVAILMTVFVVPKLAEIFTETGAQLPLPTRILIAISSFLIHNGFLVVLATLGAIALLFRLAKTKRGKRAIDGLFLRFPVFGPIIQKVNLARFTRSLSSLLSTNIPIIETFSIISRTMGNLHYRTALGEAGSNLRTGSTIAKVLSKYPRLFPPLTTQMISVGEESGSLDTIAGELATFYEDEVDQTMSNLSSIIEPILMLILGAGVAGMAVSVILPIYSLSQQIG